MKAVVYARYSSDNQREESIDAQLRACREYAAHEGLTLVGAYTDEARSATTDQRPKFLQMMQDATKRGFGAVIVHKLDRFSRDRYDSAYYKRHLKKHGVRLISVMERLDDTPASIMMESVLEGMAEYYSRNLALEVMKGMRENAYKAMHTGGKPPLGFDVAPDRTYAINQAEAEAVKLVFDRYAAGDGYTPIIDELNGKGYRTKLGRPFGKNSLTEILRNEKYAGVYIFNRSAAKTAGKRNSHARKDNTEIIRIEGGMPALITRDTWEAVQRRMGENKQNARNKAKQVYVLSGKVICGSCGGAMVGAAATGGRNGERYTYYECGTRRRKKTCSMRPINSKLLDSIVIDALYNSLFSPTSVGPAADRIMVFAEVHRREVPEQLKLAKKQLAGVEKDIKHIVDAIAKGMYHESLHARMDELELSKASLKDKIADAEEQEHRSSVSREMVVNYLRSYEGIREMPPSQQRKAVNVFVEKVVVYDDKVDIDILSPVTRPRGDGPEGGEFFGYDGERPASTI